jgi:hypothetical protein
MAHLAIRPGVSRSIAGLMLASWGLCGFTATVPPHARAEAVAYLVNVTVRPGYNVAHADQASSYGHGICDKVSQARSYAQVMGDVKADCNTSDEYQASYLISQAVNQLCPALIWQLRNSATHYRPPVAAGG